MNLFLNPIFFYLFVFTLIGSSNGENALDQKTDHPPIDPKAWCSYQQEADFVKSQLEENSDNKVIWQADHKIALVWRTPRGANFNSYEFKAFSCQTDGTFKEIGIYHVDTRYGWWDEKNVHFCSDGFRITLFADKNQTQVTHQFQYTKPKSFFIYRLEKEN